MTQRAPGEVNYREQARVLLVADSPCEGWPSMDAYVGALRRGLQRELEQGLLAIIQPHDSAATNRVARRCMAAWHRYVWLPGRLGSRGAPLIHILDQSYAHLVPRVADRRVVVTCHDLTPLSAPARSMGAWLYRRNIANLSAAIRVIAISDATRADLIHKLGIAPERIEVLPHGINDAFFLNRWAGNMDPLRILHVGSNARYKRVDLAIGAAIQTATTGAATEFWKVGSLLTSGQRDLLEQAGVEVREFGWVRDDVLPAIYREASVLIFPSSHEGQGKPVIEAMAVGLPVIASAIPALKEVSGGFVTLVAGEEPGDYATAIENLRSDHVVRVELSDGGMIVARRYRWVTHVARLRQIYDEVATQ